jgi:hypothetical protein
MSLSRVLVGATLAFAPCLAASAVPSVSLRWSGTTGSGSTGTSSITVSNSQPETLTLEVVVTTESCELVGLSLSLDYDFDGDDELDQISRRELNWQNSKASRTFSSISAGIASSQESSASLTGKAYGFSAGATGAGPTNVTSFSRESYS